MMIKKNIFLPVAVATLTGALFLSVSGTASAQVLNTGNVSSVVTGLLGQLSLSDADVQSVLNLALSTDSTQGQAAVDAKLSDAVVNGKISIAQKQAILDKLDELRTQAESLDLENMSLDQRHAVLQSVKDDLGDWAKLNNLDLNLLVDLSLSVGGANANVGLSL
jgi:hypothetical protein